MAIREKIERGANQALFSLLPGQLVEYPNANAVVLIKEWQSRPSNVFSKKRIIEKVYNAAIGKAIRCANADRRYPKEPDEKMFYFGEPKNIICELFPLVFTDNDNMAYVFKRVSQLGAFLRNWNGGRLMQRDLVFISENGEGEMDQIQPIVDIRRRPLKLEKYGESQAALRWVDATTGEVLGRVYGILRGKRVNKGTPARARRTFLPQIMSLVNIRNYIEANGDEKKVLGTLILARYIHSSDSEMDLREAFEKTRKTKGLTPEETARKYAKLFGINFDSLPAKSRNEILSMSSNSEIEQLRLNMSTIRDEFSESEILKSLDEVYEYVETAGSEGKVTLQEMFEGTEDEHKRAMYGQFIRKLNDIGIIGATYLKDVPLINLAYGFERGEFDQKKTLKPFPRDGFDKENKIPIYLTQMNTEGLLLEFDRKRIIDFLVEKSIIEEGPDLGKEKEWFIKNVNPSLITPFSGVEDESVTKYVFNLIHTISHVLMKQIPNQCGIGIDQIGEILFPSIPAILIFSRESGEFRLGALKDLFEHKIYPWVDISFKASRPGSCVYDPVCFYGSGACHSCLYLNEISCAHFNQGLSRHMLFSGSMHRKKVGFWDKTLKKF